MLSAELALEVLLFGGVGFWLVALVPAAVICVRQGEWGGFLAGWLTLGLAWIACAAALLPRRHALPALALSMCSIVLLGAFAARPTPILGLNGAALDDSLGGAGVYLSSAPCERLEAGVWRCGRYDATLSSEVPYRLTVDGLGCWEARREVHGRALDRVRYSGCVSIVDELF